MNIEIKASQSTSENVDVTRQDTVEGVYSRQLHNELTNAHGLPLSPEAEATTEFVGKVLTDAVSDRIEAEPTKAVEAQTQKLLAQNALKLLEEPGETTS